MNYKGIELRHELKYYINELEYNYLNSRLKVITRIDENTDENGEYHVRSLYFDDISNSSYNQKEGGVFQRKKYRIRIYNKSDSVILLEKKEKFDKYISKSNRLINKVFYNKLINNDLNIKDFLKDEFLLEFYTEIKMNSLKPVVIVDYIREPYIYSSGNVRITFDKKLQTVINSYDIFDSSSVTTSPIIDGGIILEVKYDDYLPEFIRRELRMERHQQMALSKYTICRDFKNNLDWREREL